MGGDILSMSLVETSIGDLAVAYSNDEVLVIRSGAELARFGPIVAWRYGRPPGYRGTAPSWVAQTVEEYIAGARPSSLPQSLGALTDFERSVYAEVCRIPRGETRSYGWISSAIGKPASSRAVGQAMARNPYPLMVPCHRVLPASGVVGHYALGGPSVKARLLVAEGADVVPSLTD